MAVPRRSNAHPFVGPVLIAHHALERLAGGISGKLRFDHDVTYLLKARAHARVDPGLELAGLDVAPWLEHHRSERRLAPLLVRYAEDRDFLHGGVADDYLLDVAGIDVDTAGDDQ